LPDTQLRVRVHPRAGREKIEVNGDDIEIWVTAPPVDGRANIAVIAALARALSCPPSSVQIAGGQTSRWKRVVVSGLDAEAVRAKLRS
jgi:uncharacterized protein (TIGR00251 family)